MGTFDLRARISSGIRKTSRHLQMEHQDFRSWQPKPHLGRLRRSLRQSSLQSIRGVSEGSVRHYIVSWTHYFGQSLNVNAWFYGHRGHPDPEDIFSCLKIGRAYVQDTVQSSGTHQSRVQDVGSVGSCHYCHTR